MSAKAPCQVLVLVWQALYRLSYTSLVPGQLVFNVTIGHSQLQNQVLKKMVGMRTGRVFQHSNEIERLMLSFGFQPESHVT